MPYSLLPFILIVAGAVAVLFVLIKKFPQIALLDVDKLPQEIEAKKKKAILEERYARALKKFGEQLKKIGVPLLKIWKKIQILFREKVQKTYLQYAKTKARLKTKQKVVPPPEAVAAILKDAETRLLMENFDEAEQKYIEVIRLAPRTVEAYRGLGRLYFSKKQWQEARETYEFLLKLNPKDGRALNRLGMIAAEDERWRDAVSFFKQSIETDNKVALRYFDLGFAYFKLSKPLNALRSYEHAVALEPMNPKYLDAYLSTAIELKNKDLATMIFEQLKIANPENKKLDELLRKIDEL